MIATAPTFVETCNRLYAGFFEKHPNNALRDLVNRTLPLVVKRQESFPGKAEGWAAGILFAVASRGCGVPDVLNSDLEKAFDVKMSTIYKRSWAIRRLLGLIDY